MEEAARPCERINVRAGFCLACQLQLQIPQTINERVEEALNVWLVLCGVVGTLELMVPHGVYHRINAALGVPTRYFVDPRESQEQAEVVVATRPK